jgi:hypothetical protein
MLEKTGAVTLTEEELIQAKSGILPDRIKQTWDLSLSELSSIISSGNYQTTGGSTSATLNKTKQ